MRLRREFSRLNLQSDDFALFGLAPRFAQDRDAIDARWKELQREAHPDRFAAQGAAAQRVAMQWSVRINEAYQRLKNPLSRAAYLCELHGVPVRSQDNTAMPPEFLMRQIEWREALDEAADEAALEALHQQVLRSYNDTLASCARLLDEAHDYARAAGQVRALMFLERFMQAALARLDQLGQ